MKSYFNRLGRNGAVYRFDLYPVSRDGRSTYTITGRDGFYVTDTAFRASDGTLTAFVHGADGVVLHSVTFDSVHSLSEALLDYHLAHPEIAESRRTSPGELASVRALLIARRKALGLTQTAVARLMRSTPGAVQDFEKRESVGWSALADYATAVGVRLSVSVG